MNHIVRGRLLLNVTIAALLIGALFLIRLALTQSAGADAFRRRILVLGAAAIMLEAGIMLSGSEVKSLRTGQSNIAESYASVEQGELWLINSYIATYKQAGIFGHEERRRRKLLVSRKELSRLWQATGREGMTLVPLVMYFNDRGRVKIKIGIAKGKKAADKRETEAKRDWNRQKQRLLKQG